LFGALFEVLTDVIDGRQTQRTQFGVGELGWLGIEVALEIRNDFLRRAVIVEPVDLGARRFLDVLEFLLFRFRAALRLGLENRFERTLFEKARQLVFLAVGNRSPRARLSAKRAAAADVPTDALLYRGVGACGPSGRGTNSIVIGK
jgi:hypothetical protein